MRCFGLVLWEGDEMTKRVECRVVQSVTLQSGSETPVEHDTTGEGEPHPVVRKCHTSEQLPYGLILDVFA